MATKKEVATAEAEVQLPVSMDELAKDAGIGNESLGMADLAVPYWSVLQGLSPQVQEGHAKFLPNAKTGMVFNTATDELYPGKQADNPAPFIFVPCAYERKYIEWIDRDTGGGGYVGEHDIESDILKFTERDEKGWLRLKSDPTHLIVETAYHYGLGYSYVSQGWERGIISMKSTQLKVNRKWNGQISRTMVKVGDRFIVAPRWLYPYMLFTVAETNKRNQTYYSWVPVKAEQTVDAGVYQMAKEYHDLAVSGAITRAPETEAPTSDGGDDEIPF